MSRLVVLLAEREAIFLSESSGTPHPGAKEWEASLTPAETRALRLFDSLVNDVLKQFRQTAKRLH